MDETRRRLIKAAVYGVPALLSLQAMPAFADACKGAQANPMTGRDESPSPIRMALQKMNKRIKAMRRVSKLSKKRS